MTSGWLAARGLEEVGVDEGQALVAALLTQQAPLRLVDRLLGLRRGSCPAVAAALSISGQEPVLAGHFPGRPIWPGSYTIEGLAQTCALAGGLLDAKAGGPASPLVLVAGVKVKLTGVVVPPSRLEYFVQLVNLTDGLLRFDVEAAVGGRQVAVGTIDVVARTAPGGLG